MENKPTYEELVDQVNKMRRDIDFLAAKLLHMNSQEQSKPMPPNPRWKPRLGEGYYTLGANGLISPIISYADDICTDYIYQSGNIYHTEEDAKFAKKRLQVLADMREWAGNWNDKFVLLYRSDKDAVSAESIVPSCDTFGEMRFVTQEDARNCIESVGEDNIIRYYFMIDENGRPNRGLK